MEGVTEATGRAGREPGVTSESHMRQSEGVMERDVSRSWEDQASGPSGH